MQSVSVSRRAAIVAGAAAGLALCAGGCDPAAADADAALFVYVCGGDLESVEGRASACISELLADDVPEGVRVVVQTGGSRHWHAHGIAGDHPQRWEVRGGELVLLQDLAPASMGQGDTLRDFLEWGTGGYWARRNMLVLWGHGSPTGCNVCFDEVWDDDALALDELEAALADASLPGILDLVAFDACFMANADVMAAVGEHAHYMVASQQEVPAKSFCYEELASDFARAGAVEAGRSFCDAFIARCEGSSIGRVADATLIDLLAFPRAIDAIDAYSAYLHDALRSSVGTIAAIASGVSYAAVYAYTGAVDLFDLGTFAEQTTCADEGAREELLQALGELVVYHVATEATQTHGVSVFYPLRHDMSKLDTYLEQCHIDAYRALLSDMFDGEPKDALALDDAGHATSDGALAVSVADGDARRIASVACEVSSLGDDGEPRSLLGTSAAVQKDWDAGSFEFEFAGRWIAFDGATLYAEVVEDVPGRITYACPVTLNGFDKELLVTYEYADDPTVGSYAPWSVREGTDLAGVPMRTREELCEGDELITRVRTLGGWRTYEPGETRVVGASAAPWVREDSLPDGRYRCRFVIDDLMGNRTRSDCAVYEVVNGEAKLVEVVFADA